MSSATQGATLWVLITVATGGAVHQVPGFHSQPICEDALSIAKYGMTVAEHEADERRREAALKKEVDAWRAEHPPRPATKAELEGGAEVWAGTQGCGHQKDGLIYDDPCPNEAGFIWIWPSGETYTRSWPARTEIRFARCLPDPDAKGIAR